MRVLCTGPESSGTRMLTRLVSNLGVCAVHKSVPHALKWWDETKDVDRVIIIVRDPFITAISGVEAGHPGYWDGKASEYPYRLTYAWEVMIDNVRAMKVPWIPVTYEGLIARPQWTVDRIAEWLGVEPRPLEEEIRDPRGNL